VTFSLLEAGVVIVSVALVATKFLDCWSTTKHMEDPTDETNPLARGAMIRLGPQTTIWGIFVLVVVIVVIVGGSAYKTAAGLEGGSDSILLHRLSVWGYLILGSGIAMVQAAVAQTNRSGGFNWISGAVLAVNEWVQSLCR
jgi:hypothetical protein